MNYKIHRINPFGILLEAIKKNTHVKDLDVEHLRKLFAKEHLVVLRGFDTFKTSNDFSNYCHLWGKVSLWPFGKVLELIERENPEDHIFDHNYVPLHWDGMYRSQIPEYQIFHCVQAPLSNQGGRTTFSNTALALQQASLETKNLWNKVTGIYERKMEFYHSKIVSPIIVKHPFKDSSIIRYNEPPESNREHFVNPPKLEFIGLHTNEIEIFHRSLKEALYASTNFYAHDWQIADVVIADNFTLLHGREKFLAKSPRHLQRVHVLSNPPFNNLGLESYQ